MKKLVEQLRPPEPIKGFIDGHEEWAQMRARQLGIAAKYVTTQALLHLPYYDREDIVSEQSNVLNELDVKILNLGESYSTVYDRLYVATDLSLLSTEANLKGKSKLNAHDGSSILPIRFGEVPDYVADEVGNRLHYIRSARHDSVANYGLYVDGVETPYASASFSRCKRGYQIDALNQITGLALEPRQIFSMTRAFSFNGAPKNSMSKLFQQTHKHIKQDFPEVKAIITALNPYTGFDGSIFMGSSYTPYALSPMEYWYNEEGYYVPRSKGVQIQRTDTPPIIWMAHGIDKGTARRIEQIPINNIKTITLDEYKKG